MRNILMNNAGCGSGRYDKVSFKAASRQRSGTMKKDPFGNLADYQPVLELVHDLADKGELAECQPGLIRILRYKGNWRLREADF